MGYPTSDVFCGLQDGGCGQHFERGSVYWSNGTVPSAVIGPLRDRWSALGWETGRLGYPTREPAAYAHGGSWQPFQGGILKLIGGRVSVTYR